MATICFKPVRGKRLRATRLDQCGNVPVSGTADSVVTTGGFITINLSSEVEDGTEIIQKRADGSLCVNEMSSPSFKRFNVEIEFCGVDPDLLELTTNAVAYADHAGDNAGFTVPEGTIDSMFALEVWTGLSGQACPTGVEEASGYMLLPFVNAGVIGDVEVSEGSAVTFSMTGAFTRGGNGWSVGPYDVVLNGGSPSPLPTALDSLDHLLIIQTGVAPPAEACGFTAMP